MELPADFELGPKMQACSPMERKFVWVMVLEAENATAAARKAGYVDHDNGAIRVRAHQLAHRERVIEAMEEVGRRIFRTQLPAAIKANRALLENPKHPDHHKAVQATLSRLGLVERTAVDLTVSGEIAVNHTDAAVGDLRALLALGVAREKLIEVFGFSGLARYEKMLAEQERRALLGPVIEHVSRETSEGENGRSD